jgi:hypothetical protein
VQEMEQFKISIARLNPISKGVAIYSLIEQHSSKIIHLKKNNKIAP